MSAFLRRKKGEAQAVTARPALDNWTGSVRLTRGIAEEMIGEVADWRTLIGGKGLSLPV
jgi:hypothetical protein